MGRGPLAGPVGVGVFVFLNEKTNRKFSGVKESKQLTEEAREKWFTKIEEGKRQGTLNFAVTLVSEKVIDTKGLSYAIRTAMKQSLGKLGLLPQDCMVLLDGGLKAPIEYLFQETIIKGDEKKKVIALASIAAKVLRDRKMKQYATRYRGYDFEINKGYGTLSHRRQLQLVGPCPLHRRSFLTKILANKGAISHR